MAFDTIRAGVNVVTRIGRTAGQIHGVVRHSVTRAVTAVIVAPNGVADPEEFIVTSARNLRAV